MDKVWEILHREWQTDPGTVSLELLREIYRIQTKNQFEPDRQLSITRMRDAVQLAIDTSIAPSDGESE